MIEKLILDCIQSCFTATVIQHGEKKRESVARASALFDTLKLYIRIAVDTHCLQEKTYLKLIPILGEIGKMLGGWIKAVNSNPNSNSKSQTNSNFQNQI
jgi:hypothetical protein